MDIYCKNCRFFSYVEGECRRRAPSPRFDADLSRDSVYLMERREGSDENFNTAAWPTVRELDWCGEFEEGEGGEGGEGGFMAVEMKPVKSSNISAIGHHPETKTLHVAFSNGTRYIYHDVDAEKHKALMSADSVGSYFHAHIRGGGHKFTKGGE